MPALTIFDLDQLVPDDEWFKVRGQEIGIAPVFSVADNARYSRIQERLQYETLLAAEAQARREAYNRARGDAESRGTTLPDPPLPVERDEAFQPYTNDDFDRDTIELLARIWQASEAAKPADERAAVNAALVKETFTRTQAWAVVQRLWPRRYGQRTAAPAVQPSAPEPAAEPAPTKPPRRSARSSTASS